MLFFTGTPLCTAAGWLAGVVKWGMRVGDSVPDLFSGDENRTAVAAGWMELLPPEWILGISFWSFSSSLLVRQPRHAKRIDVILPTERKSVTLSSISKLLSVFGLSHHLFPLQKLNDSTR